MGRWGGANWLLAASLTSAHRAAAVTAHHSQLVPSQIPLCRAASHTNCFVNYSKTTSISIYCSVKNLGNRVENVSYCMDDDVKACCKEIYLFVSGPADLTQFILVGAVIIPLRGKKSFAHGPSVTGVGTS